jgi:hypothetical protein
MFKRIAAVSFIISILLHSAHPQAVKPFGGHVFDAQSKRGIANLEVRLRPPTGSTAPTMLGTTNQNGIFRFAQVKPGRYLLEVSQGPYMLYRAETDTTKVDSVEIAIERR